MLSTRKSTGLNIQTQAIADPNALVDVYCFDGRCIKTNVKRNEAILGLKNGVYIIDHQKTVVNIK